MRYNELEVGKIYRNVNHKYEYDYKLTKDGLYYYSHFHEKWIESESSFNDIFKTEFIEIKRVIDWTKVPPFTKSQVRDSKDQSWRNKYFLRLNDNQFKKDFPFVATAYDEFIYEGTSGHEICFKQCRIHPSVEIPDEWYKYIEEE